MADQRSSPINIENPEAKSPSEEGTSPQTSLVGSLIDNAMKGAQAATNYLLSFIPSPEQQPQSALHSPTERTASAQSSASSDSRALAAEHESQVLAAWRKASIASGPPPTAFPTHLIFSEYKKRVILERPIPEHPILSLDALSIVSKILLL
jgi:hypothetical protein